uniref:Uncharacterized protein n=1 Tax=Plectus sambesii TaxID=2011161 RepID=A0A914V6I7_9BILA
MRAAAGRLRRKWSSGSSLTDSTSLPRYPPRHPINSETLMRRYRKEEDEFLHELELMQRSLEAKAAKDILGNDGRTPSAASLSSKASKKMERPSSTATANLAALSQAGGEECRPQSAAMRDALEPLCRLLGYMSRLRKENRHLKRQMACLNEMRQIDQLHKDIIAAQQKEDDSGCTGREEAPVQPADAPPPSPGLLAVKLRRPAAPSKAADNCATVAGGRGRPRSAQGSNTNVASSNSLLLVPARRTAVSRIAAAMGKKKPPPPGLSALPRPTSSVIPIKEPIIRQGARERLTTPPRLKKAAQDPLSISSCSTDASSGAEFRQIPQIPPPRRVGRLHYESSLAARPLPEVSDSDADQAVFSEVSLPDYNPDQAPRFRHSIIRRSEKELASPTSSASDNYGSVGMASPTPSRKTPSEIMSGSRSSFLEKIGLKKKSKEKGAPTSPLASPTPNSPPGSGIKVFVKKRKRKISESDSVSSSVAGIKPDDGPSFLHTPYIDTRPTSSLSLITGDPCDSKIISVKGELKKRSWLSHPKQQRVDVGSSSAAQRYFDRSVDGSALPRQQTAIYLDPEDEDDSLLFTDAISESYKDFDSENSIALAKTTGWEPTSKLSSRRSDDKGSYVALPAFSDISSMAASLLSVSEDSVFMPGELTVKQSEQLIGQLLTMQEKNSLLLKQLSSKSREYDHITEQLEQLEREVRGLKGRYRLDAVLERLTLTNQPRETAVVPASMLEDLECRLREMDVELRRVKEEAYKAQQGALDAFAREQMTSQMSLDQVEKLQRSNFQLLQRQMSELSLYDNDIRRRLEMMPSYDSLYTFSMSLMRKLRQLRSSLLDKSASVSRADLELMQTQSSLLLTHAQVERQKLQLRIAGIRTLKRPLSYHGEDLLTRLVNPELSFYLPFKLHGSRLSKLRSHTIDVPDSNEEYAENEFLRLFDYARRLSQTYEELPVRDAGLPSLRQIGLPPASQYQSIIPRHNDIPTASASSQQPVYRKPQPPPPPPPSTAIIRPTRPLLSSLYALREGLRTGQSQGRRPQSLIEGPRPIQITGDIRRLTQDVSRNGNYTRNQEQQINYQSIQNQDDRMHQSQPQSINLSAQGSTPLNLHKLGNCGQVRAIVSSFQDVSSAPTTPTSRIASYALPESYGLRKPTPPPPRRVLVHPTMQGERNYDLPPNYGSSSASSSEYGTLGGMKTNHTYVNMERQSNAVNSRLPARPSPLLSPQSVLRRRAGPLAAPSPTPSRTSIDPPYETLSRFQTTAGEQKQQSSSLIAPRKTYTSLLTQSPNGNANSPPSRTSTASASSLGLSRLPTSGGTGSSMLQRGIDVRYRPTAAGARQSVTSLGSPLPERPHSAAALSETEKLGRIQQLEAEMAQTRSVQRIPSIPEETH